MTFTNEQREAIRALLWDIYSRKKGPNNSVDAIERIVNGPGGVA